MKNQKPLPGMTRTGEELRDEAMEEVEEHAGEDWNELAYEVVLLVATRMELFKADDIHNWARFVDLPKPHEPRAWGPVMSRAIKAGVCVPTGVWVKTNRSSRHAAPTRQYRSLREPF